MITSEMVLNGCSYTRKGILIVAFVKVRKDRSNPFFYNHVIHKCSSVKTPNGASSGRRPDAPTASRRRGQRHTDHALPA